VENIMFHAAKHFVSHCRTLCLKPLKHDSTPYAWDELYGWFRWIVWL